VRHEVSILPQINKTLKYRRARFNIPGQNLEQLARQAWGQFATHVDRAINGTNHATVAGMRGRDEGGLGFSVHGADGGQTEYRSATDTLE
jgi:hypothetical protein